MGPIKDKEIDQQVQGGVYSIVKRSSIPKMATLLPCVWQLTRKRDIITGEIKKHKARLNIDGSRMVQHRDYDQTYAPVASWPIIRLFLILTLINNWHTLQLDYVLAYPQAPIDRDMYMHIPKGFEVQAYGIKDAGDYVLKIHQNIYGNKAGG